MSFFGKLGNLVIGVFGLALPFILIGALVYASANWSEWWWYWTVGRSVEQADQLMADNHADQAIPLLREALAQHPDDARLYYSLGGAYYADGQEFAALACLVVFVKTAPHHSSADSDRSSRAAKAIDDLVAPMPREGSGAPSKSYASDGANLLNGAVVTYNRNELSGWKKLIKDYALQDILGQSAVAPAANELGLISPSRFAAADLFLRGDGKSRPRITARQLRDMILSGAYTIAAPEVGSGCCTVSLADPDLRATPYVLQQGLERAAGLNDADKLNRTLNLKSRLGIKRRFVYDLIVDPIRG